VKVNGTLVTPTGTWPTQLKLHGASSRTHPKKSFRLFFDAPLKTEVFGQKRQDEPFPKIILKASWKDQSLMREWLGFAVLSQLGQEVPGVGWAHLYVNGTYHGLYVILEPIDELFLTRRGRKAGGALYKGVGQKAGFHNDIDVELGFEKKTQKDKPFDDLKTLLQLAQAASQTDDEFWQQLDPVFSLDRYADRLIWASFTQNIDSWKHNFYLYHDPEGSPRRWWIYAWDSDICFANHWQINKASYPFDYEHMLNGPTLIGKYFSQVPAMRAWFVARFLTLLQGKLAEAEITPLANWVFAKVGRDLACDLSRWQRPSTAELEWGYISEFLRKRPVFLRERLKALALDPNITDLP